MRKHENYILNHDGTVVYINSLLNIERTGTWEVNRTAPILWPWKDSPPELVMYIGPDKFVAIAGYKDRKGWGKVGSFVLNGDTVGPRYYLYGRKSFEASQRKERKMEMELLPLMPQMTSEGKALFEQALGE